MKAKIDYYLNLAFEDKQSRVYHIVNDILAIVIVFSVILVITESVEELRFKYSGFFDASEYIIMAIFTLEYLVYIYLAPKKGKYIFSFFGIVDLLAILPTYLGFLFLPILNFKSLRVLRIVRVLRLLRLLRLLKLIASAQRRHPNEKLYFKGLSWYNIEIFFFGLISVTTISGTLVYLVERGVEGTQFTNIPQGLWWAIQTVVTLGYGDIIPVTFTGRMFASITMVISLMFIAILVSVVGKMMQKILFGTPGEIIEEERHKREELQKNNHQN